MSNFFIYYGVSTSQQLFISCYHDNFAALVSFKTLTKKQNLSATKKIGNLSANENEIKETILNELAMIQSNIAALYPQITEIHYRGDVNLGFGGQEIFPAFLMDGSLQKSFKGHKYFAKAPLFVCLESYNDEIARKAAKTHSQHYAKAHNETYSDCAVTIKSKLSVKPLYNSSNGWLSTQSPSPKSPKARPKMEMLNSVTHLLRQRSPYSPTTSRHAFYQQKKIEGTEENEEVIRAYSPGQTRK
ncbi:hypothetical protein ACD661_06420 [Legionella lytica]|uniref:Uncharacterized protein n=1 Tax=Legionella lytica TaxID=96232 RepID=A0ABW8DA66_9GAMM